MKIRDLKIRQIFTTNLLHTLEVEVFTTKVKARASVPIGTSKSKHEAVFIQTKRAIEKFGLIKKHFLDEFDEQKDVDSLLHIIDKTENFEQIGGNLALAISSACLKAFALEAGEEVYEYLGQKKIPKPICNVAGGWKGQSDVQEFLLLPSDQTSFFESTERIAKAYLELGKQLSKLDPSFKFARNLESAWVTSLSTEQLLSTLGRLIQSRELRVGLDVAASSLWNGEAYVYSGKQLSSMQQIEYMVNLAQSYNLAYLEDPIQQDDFTSFSTLTKNLPKVLVCGDDLLATNLRRLKHGVEMNAVSAVLIKPNQVGTVSDTIEFFEEAKRNRLATVFSHRSGETEEALVCHLAVGLGADYIKLGIAGERTVKVNELIRIEERISS